METTEKIVEAYVRYLKGWATIPNIKCPGQYEIDLLAIDTKSAKRFHIESGVSISGAFSKLTTKPFSEEELKKRGKQAQQRRTLGYFLKRKFAAKGVIETLRVYGFEPGNYTRVIVTWGATDAAQKEARNQGIELFYFPDIMAEIAEVFKDRRTYFTDDTLRTLHLYSKVLKEAGVSGIHRAIRENLAEQIGKDGGQVRR